MKLIARLVFILWGVLYILQDLHLFELFDMDMMPFPVLVILYLAVLGSDKEMDSKKRE